MLIHEAAAALEVHLGQHQFAVPVAHGKWWWTGSFAVGSRVDKVVSEIPKLVTYCEQRGVTEPGGDPQIRSDETGQAWLKWLSDHGVRLEGHPKANTAHRGSVSLQSASDIVADNLEAVPPWLSEWLLSEQGQRKVAKLKRSSCRERHLFLIVDDAKAPFASFNALASADEVPVDHPNLSNGVEVVWLAPRYSPAVLKFDAEHGWSRHRTHGCDHEWTANDQDAVGPILAVPEGSATTPAPVGELRLATQRCQRCGIVATY